MKHSKLLVTLFSMLPLIAYAQDEGVYVGAGLGLTEFENGIEFLESSDAGFEPGGRIFVGYDFNQNWSTEIGYTSYGESSGQLINDFPSEVSYDTTGIYLSGIYHWNFAEQWSADFMLGVARVSGETEVVDDELCATITTPIPGFNNGQPLYTSCKSTDKAWGVSAGVGATWAISDHIKLRGTFDINKLEFDDEGSDISGNLESNDLFEIPYRLGLDLIWKF